MARYAIRNGRLGTWGERIAVDNVDRSRRGLIEEGRVRVRALESTPTINQRKENCWTRGEEAKYKGRSQGSYPPIQKEGVGSLRNWSRSGSNRMRPPKTKLP